MQYRLVSTRSTSVTICNRQHKIHIHIKRIIRNLKAKLLGLCAHELKSQNFGCAFANKRRMITKKNKVFFLMFSAHTLCRTLKLTTNIIILFMTDIILFWKLIGENLELDSMKLQSAAISLICSLVENIKPVTAQAYGQILGNSDFLGSKRKFG